MPPYRVSIVPLALLLSVAASASQEGILSLGTFQLSSPGIGQSGPVIVSGARKGEEVTAFCVQAFEQTRCLSTEQLVQVVGTLVNGVQLSYAAGYRETGGRTVYVVLSRGFVSGRNEGKVVSVSEFGPIEVKDAPKN
jgi:hypothetical protein